MFTSGLNKDTTNVIGLINPCHKPNQKPAAPGSVPASSFGPAAHAASSHSAPTSGTAYLAPGRWMPSRFMAITHSLGGFDHPRTGPDPKSDRHHLGTEGHSFEPYASAHTQDQGRKQRECHSPSRRNANPRQPGSSSPLITSAA